MHEKVSCKYHAALVSELASLNSNVRALTEAIVSSLKQLENRLQRRMDAEETPAANTSIGKMTNFSPPPPVSDPEGPDRTKFYTRANPASRGKEVVREPTPPAPEDILAAIADDGAGGSTSPGSDCALISPPRKAPKPSATPRKRAAANARGKAIAKERGASAGDEEPTGTGSALTALPAKKVSKV